MSLDSNNFPQMPRGGAGQLRALLQSLNEDEEKLTTDPRYREGYDDGYKAAQENYRLLTAALANVYKIDMDNKF